MNPEIKKSLLEAEKVRAFRDRAEVTQSKLMALLKELDSTPLVFYRNGLCSFDGMTCSAEKFDEAVKQLAEIGPSTDEAQHLRIPSLWDQPFRNRQ